MPATRTFSYVLVLIGCCLLLYALWKPFLPAYLVSFDQVNFALSVQKFSPEYHQPQPPGYPLFVLVLKACAWIVGNIRIALFLSGVLGGALALFFVYLVGAQMFNWKAGLAASILLVSNAVFWDAGLQGPVRLWLAATSSMVAFMTWRQWQDDQSFRWLYLSSLSLGILAGFRPEVLVLFTPLLVWTAVHRRAPKSVWLKTILLGVVGGSTWLLYLFAHVSSVTHYGRVVSAYFQSQTADTSLLTGASVDAAGQMAFDSIMWISLAILPWLWLVPFAWQRLVQERWKERGIFIFLCLVPALFFHMAVHARDPDHVLVEIPLLCLLGGKVIADTAASISSHIASALVLVGISLMVFIIGLLSFFHPFTELIKTPSYQDIWLKAVNIRETVESLQELERQGPVYVIAYGDYPSWRLLMYHLPLTFQILALQSPPQQLGSLSAYVRDSASLLPVDPAKIRLPNCGILAVVIPPVVAFRTLLPDANLYYARQDVLYRWQHPGSVFRWGNYDIRSTEDCRASWK